jgi:hypothetical protein
LFYYTLNYSLYLSMSYKTSEIYMARLLIKNLAGIILVLSMAGCVTTAPPPAHTQNICSIFNEEPKWYFAALDSQKRWGVPLSVTMSIIYQESGYHSGAKPAREWYLGIIPGFRPTSAFGYSQATDDSWRVYKRDTASYAANRSSFSAAADFIGWYADQAQRKAHISKGDPYRLYLAYHEGIGGYMRGTYRHKKWLINIAHKVEKRAWLYHKQLHACQRDLPQESWWF